MVAAPDRVALPALGTVLSLLAGRGAFRIAYHALALVLLAWWGAEVFGIYAGAVGATAWLALLSSGPEKTVLKLVPRLPRTAPAVVRTALLTAAVPLAIAALCAVALAGSAAVVYPLAAAWSAGLGLLTVVVAVHRATGRPQRDSRGFLLLTALLVMAAGAGAILRPAGQLIALAAMTAGAAAWSARGIDSAGKIFVRARRGTVTAVLRCEVLLGLYEPLTAASVGLLYAVLTVGGQHRDSTTLYLTLLVSSVIGSLLLYLLRIYQPASSLRLRGSGARTGIAVARRLFATALLAVGSGCALVAVIAESLSTTALLAILLGCEIPLHAVVSLALFLLENTGDHELTIAATAAASQFASVAVLAPLLVPTHGPAAALWVLVASYGALAAAALLGLGRPR
ncbi:hypothetical protein [Nocardia crassostreae]|uniref:hypothetical protein n=1 Tax=Nocardia crassostreae TaxID=53428 RepID=UPI000A865A5F|nr:hypothetical protein [Nocardia crassostreae]